jgi:hypothetical protein
MCTSDMSRHIVLAIKLFSTMIAWEMTGMRVFRGAMPFEILT